MDQNLPVSYPPPSDGYFTSQGAASSPLAPVPLPHQPNFLGERPDCFLTLRCDGCEMLFDEARAGEPRYTFPCRHVYCLACMDKANTVAAQRNVHVLCSRCGNYIVRKRDNQPCTHQIPAVAFDARYPQGFEKRLPDRFRLALGQKTGPKCQRCWLVARLQHITCRLAQRYDTRPFPGELFACVEVDSGSETCVVHGMMREVPEARVDLADDLELHRENLEQELLVHASDICGGLGQIPMEPNFDPRGHLIVRYRLRGWHSWVRQNRIDQRLLPVALRAAVFGNWV